MHTPDSPREVRLRPEFAELYSGLPAGWIPAAEWADVIVARAREARSLSIHRRTFDPGHFEFRGGAPPRAPAQRHLRTRAGDRR
jgi:hypothetical protein